MQLQEPKAAAFPEFGLTLGNLVSGEIANIFKNNEGHGTLRLMAALRLALKDNALFQAEARRRRDGVNGITYLLRSCGKKKSCLWLHAEEPPICKAECSEVPLNVAISDLFKMPKIGGIAFSAGNGGDILLDRGFFMALHPFCMLPSLHVQTILGKAEDVDAEAYVETFPGLPSWPEKELSAVGYEEKGGRYVITAVSTPSLKNPAAERRALRATYEGIFSLANKLGIKTIALPVISEKSSIGDVCIIVAMASFLSPVVELNYPDVHIAFCTENRRMLQLLRLVFDENEVLLTEGENSL